MSESQHGGATAGKGTPLAVDVATTRRTITTLALFLAGPVVSSVHFMVVYLAVEAGCTGDGPGLDAFDPPAPTTITLASTAVAALMCLAATGWAVHRWRANRDDWVGSLSFAGVLLSVIGLATVLFVGLPALVLPACGP